MKTRIPKRRRSGIRLNRLNLGASPCDASILNEKRQEAEKKGRKTRAEKLARLSQGNAVAFTCMMRRKGASGEVIAEQLAAKANAWKGAAR